MDKIDNYIHDREIEIDCSSKSLYEFISKWILRDEIAEWYSMFEDEYNIPELVLRVYYGKYIADSFDYIYKKRFKSKVLFRGLLSSVFKYIVVIAYVWFYRRRKLVNKVKVKLLIDHVEWQSALDRFDRIVGVLGESNVAVVVPSAEHVVFEGYVFNREKYKDLDFSYTDLYKSLKILVCGIWLSVRYKVNVVSVSMSALCSLYYGRSVFNMIESKYMIRYQHYHTDSIHNYIFKEMCGGKACVIQKNAHHLGVNGFFYDADIFFAIGTGSAQRALEFGARLNKVVPAGSFFMSGSWGRIIDNGAKERDIVFVGGKTHYPGSYCDIYDTHNSDYSDQLRWLARISVEYPEMRVGFKHHSDYVFRDFESDIFNDSNVEIISGEENSYAVCASSRMVVSWGSTMIYEMISQSKPSFYLNPGGRNHLFVDDKRIYEVSIKTYQEFVDKAISVVKDGKGKEIMQSIDKDKFCIGYKDVNELIIGAMKF